jgi:hypothetical protein
MNELMLAGLMFLQNCTNCAVIELIIKNKLSGQITHCVQMSPATGLCSTSSSGDARIPLVAPKPIQSIKKPSQPAKKPITPSKPTSGGWGR